MSAYSGTNGLENLTYVSAADITSPGSGNFRGTGNNFNNIITGGTGNDTLDGGNGNDTLIGGAGADSLNGGTGTNTVSYSSSTQGVTITLSGGGATGSGGDAQGDTLVNIQNIIGSSSTANTLTGDTNANVLTGGSGADTLAGGGGADTIYGGLGNDVITINTADIAAATARIDGGGGTDKVSFSGVGTATVANLVAALTNVEQLDFTLPSAVANLSFTAANQLQSITGVSSGSAVLNVTTNSGDTLTALNYAYTFSSGATTSYIWEDAQNNEIARLVHTAV